MLLEGVKKWQIKRCPKQKKTSSKDLDGLKARLRGYRE